VQENGVGQYPKGKARQEHHEVAKVTANPLVALDQLDSARPKDHIINIEAHVYLFFFDARIKAAIVGTDGVFPWTASA
jgi:hypothetical protein